MTQTKMNMLLATTAVLALSACGSSSTPKVEKPPLSEPERLSVSVPSAQATRLIDVSNIDNINEILEILENEEEGAGASIPVSLALRAIGMDDEAQQLADLGDDEPQIFFIAGQSVAGKRVYYSNFESVSGLIPGERTVYLMDKLKAVLFQAGNAEFESIEFVENNSRNLNIGILRQTGDDGYRELEAAVESDVDEDDYVTVDIIKGVMDGENVFRIRAQGSSDTFSQPVGAMTYSGRGALQWDDNIAVGDVTMTATFDSSSTASIVAKNLLTENDLSAGFSGDVIINNTTGLYGSSGAQIVIGEDTMDAGIIGAFNRDATATAGAVFDGKTGGENVSGVFGLVKD